MMDDTACCGTTNRSYDGAIVPSKTGADENSGVAWGLVRKIADIIDGTSNTMMVGEKYVDANGAYNPSYQRPDGGYWGLCNDDQGFVDGYDNDTICSANGLNTANVELPKKIWVTENNDACGLNFGSIHDSLMAVFCDGSVHNVSYTIDPQVWLNICVINDGLDTGFLDQ